LAILADIHTVFFNAVLMFSGLLGVWAIGMAAQNRGISGNYWGALATLTGLSAATMLVGTILALQGFVTSDGRMMTYFLYMAWLVIIIPGMFTQLRGRDDSAAALAFAMLSVFNLFVGLSMQSRGLITWIVG
jgi:hypothetical protein